MSPDGMAVEELDRILDDDRFVAPGKRPVELSDVTIEVGAFGDRDHALGPVRSSARVAARRRRRLEHVAAMESEGAIATARRLLLTTEAFVHALCERFEPDDWRSLLVAVRLVVPALPVRAIADALGQRRNTCRVIVPGTGASQRKSGHGAWLSHTPAEIAGPVLAAFGQGYLADAQRAATRVTDPELADRGLPAGVRRALAGEGVAIDLRDETAQGALEEAGVHDLVGFTKLVVFPLVASVIEERLDAREARLEQIAKRIARSEPFLDGTCSSCGDTVPCRRGSEGNPYCLEACWAERELDRIRAPSRSLRLGQRRLGA